MLTWCSKRSATDVGQDGRDAVAVDLDRAGPVGDIRDDLQRDPQPAAAGHRDGMRPEVEDVLRIGRVEHGHPEVGQQDLRGARNGRGLRRGVVADERDRAAARVRADQVGVANGVEGPVQAGRLAVPVPGTPSTRQPPDSRELAALTAVAASSSLTPGLYTTS